MQLGETSFADNKCTLGCVRGGFEEYRYSPSITVTVQGCPSKAEGANLRPHGVLSDESL